MDKKVFVNDEIFESDGDYIIGGFTTDQTEGFGYGDFVASLRLRMKGLIEKYLDQAVLYNVSLGMPDAEEEAKKDLALLISDNLNVKVPFTDIETVIETLMNDDRTQSWLLGIKQNIMEFQGDFAHRGIYNVGAEMDASSPAYKNAEYFTEDCTLEQFIEQLSSIEL